ncbi:MAG: alcohol dehydrogenase catalytic domain-containing protein [Gammaproteobacteria bacterium]|jgi:2-desacetyl-2-hydroxyethyl bacteriochlorophyllide A dehydrogenase|nr:alcohol dehydrogenase catalytic domain-containing protein [Gammaproteobacteria bacterium]MBT4492439.1 alcohol dehydrogenase catalytic domain-containing protein [Gammaproteobacteria bacterium]MBT7371894.1 alcohol dehydrogenase catalytic domain-containing protein [Gammaproteobacteria bacterium]
MKAAIFPGPGKPLVIQDIDKPTISDDEMLVRVARCGICGTDIHASREGPFMAPPNTVFGHEFAGEIVEIGSQVPDGSYSVGDRVTSLPFIGDQTIGLGEITGAYAEFVKVAPESAVRLPDALDDANGALVEPLAVGLHAVKRAGSVAEKNILIIGAGPIGLSCAIWCRFLGARSIVISEMSPARIDMARKLGFSDFVDPAGDVSEQFRELTSGVPEIQFECVGQPGLLQQCIERAPGTGTIMCIGVCDNPDTIIPLLALTKELTLRWAVAYEKEDFEFTIDMMASGRIDGSAMVTHVVSLDELPEIFEALRTPTDQCKVLIDLG